jgi:fumarylacetoacetase
VFGDPVFLRPSLNEFLARGPSAWAATRARLTDLVAAPRDGLRPHLVASSEATMHLPFAVADYVDFYASRHHAENAGRILRPGTDPLPVNWLHLPAGYHGRAGTVVVSGTAVTRPSGQRRPPGAPGPTFGPTERLDIEAEVGFVVGVGSQPGVPVPPDSFADHVFGVVLVNDWSARDIQAWESTPLGPFLGKSFATSISAWVVPLAALEAARVDAPRQDPPPLPYLGDGAHWGLDLSLEIALNGQIVSRPPFATMYWTPAQQLAHLTANGASLRTGDLFASGTVSGPEPDQWGSLLELTAGGARPLAGFATDRTFLEDGDEVVITATAPADDGGRLSLGEVRGRVAPVSG